MARKPSGHEMLEALAPRWGRLSDLARELGITTHHLRFLRRGERNPSRILAVKLEKVLGIPMNAWGEEAA